MSNTFDQLKANRNKALEKLKGAAEQITNPAKSYSVDDRMWKPSVDKSGSGFAIIRFLPAKAGEDLAFVRLWSHGFKNEANGKWYIENSRTTLDGAPDFASEYNTAKWNLGDKASQDGVRGRKRNLNYYSNILVVSDPTNPENDGKTFIFRYGSKIFNMIIAKIKPEFPGDVAIDPFDIWGGANFRLKIQNVAGQRSYDRSTFDEPSEVFAGDEERQKDLYDGLYSLTELVAPDKFKSYDELKKKFLLVMGEVDTSVMSSQSSVNTVSAAVLGKAASAPAKESVQSSYEDDDTDEIDISPVEDADDSSLSYFSKLAKG